MQKSQVVKMVKNYDKEGITLAIGDGGNDVSMILEAHIGVGIYGEEGLRAVQSSDYAIGEFQNLNSLLFFHGRTNYIRNAECIKYFFYKNFVFTLVQFLFGFYCNFTGQTIIDDWFITTYNLIFTALPLGGRALLDHDLKPDDGIIINKMLPFMYKENRDNPIFTIKNFIFNMIKGIIHCLINFFIVIYSFKEECFDENGNIPELWVISVCLFTNILMIVSGNLFIFTKYHTWINFLLVGITTIAAYIGFVILVHNVSYFNSVGTMVNTFNSIKIWFLFIFIFGTCLLIDFTILAFDYKFNKNISNILKIIFNAKGEINFEEDVPDEIKEKLKVYKDNEIDKNNDKYVKLKEELKNDISDNNSELKNISKKEKSEKSSNSLNRKKSGSETESFILEKEDKNYKLKSKNKNKKIIEKSNSSNNSVNSHSKFTNKSNSYSISSSKRNLNSKNSISDSDYMESNGEDDIPKKTMEFINNEKNKKKINNESDDFDDIGENYEDEFSEKMSREVKYFNPKQSNVPNFKYYENKIPRNKIGNFK